MGDPIQWLGSPSDGAMPRQAPVTLSSKELLLSRALRDADQQAAHRPLDHRTTFTTLPLDHFPPATLPFRLLAEIDELEV